MNATEVMNETASNGEGDFAAKLQKETLSVRFVVTKCSQTRTFTKDQRRKTAKQFNAKEERVGGTRRILDKTQETVKRMNSAQTAAKKTWIAMTVAIPGNDGKRLLKRSAVLDFDEKMQAHDQIIAGIRQELALAEPEIIEATRDDLADLWENNLLEPGFSADFGIAWSFEEETVPNHLAEVHPDLFKREQQRVQAMYNMAASDLVTDLAKELKKIVAHMVERLTPDADGKKKKFNHTVVDNLKDFFDKFQLLNIGNSKELEDAVASCKAAINYKGGDDQVTAEKLRKDAQKALDVKTAMAELSGKLDGMIVNRPRRKIVLTD